MFFVRYVPAKVQNHAPRFFLSYYDNQRYDFDFRDFNLE